MTRSLTLRSAHPEAEICGVTPEQHGLATFIAANNAGAGVLCPDAYLGTLIAARLFQILGEHFDPSPEELATVESAAARIIDEFRQRGLIDPKREPKAKRLN